MGMVKIVAHEAGRTVGLTFPKKSTKKSETAEKSKKPEISENPDGKTPESTGEDAQEA